MYTYNCSLIKVVDGDTCWLRVDLGFFVKVDLDIRLAEINAPELSGPTKDAGQAAKDGLASLLADAHNGIIQLQSVSRDRYGRWVGKLSFVSSSSGVVVDVNKEMVIRGWAAPYAAKLIP